MNHRLFILGERLQIYNAMIKNRDLDTKVILDGRVSAENIMEYGSKIWLISLSLEVHCVRSKSLLEDLKKLND